MKTPINNLKTLNILSLSLSALMLTGCFDSSTSTETSTTTPAEPTVAERLTLAIESASEGGGLKLLLCLTVMITTKYLKILITQFQQRKYY